MTDRRSRTHHNRYRLATRPGYRGGGHGQMIDLGDDLAQQYVYRGEEGRPDPMLAATRMRGVIHLRQLTAARVAAATQQEEGLTA